VQHTVLPTLSLTLCFAPVSNMRPLALITSTPSDPIARDAAPPPAPPLPLCDGVDADTPPPLVGVAIGVALLLLCAAMLLCVCMVCPAASTAAGAAGCLLGRAWSAEDGRAHGTMQGGEFRSEETEQRLRYPWAMMMGCTRAGIRSNSQQTA
jgi:hypothetical protein